MVSCCVRRKSGLRPSLAAALGHLLRHTRWLREQKNGKESMHSAAVTLDCDQAMMVTEHGKPMFAKVYAEGRLIIQFGFDDLMRIRSWHFAIRNHREFVPRSALSTEEPDLIENLSKNTFFIVRFHLSFRLQK